MYIKTSYEYYSIPVSKGGFFHLSRRPLLCQRVVCWFSNPFLPRGFIDYDQQMASSANINRARLLNELPRDPLAMVDIVQSVVRDAFVSVQQTANKRESELTQTLQAREALICHLEAKVVHLQKETTTATNSLDHMTAVNARVLDENNALKVELEATRAELLKLDQFRTILAQSMNQSGFLPPSSTSHNLPPPSSSPHNNNINPASHMNRSFQDDADKAEDLVSEIDKTLAHSSTTFNVFNQSAAQGLDASYSQIQAHSGSTGPVDEARALFRSAKARLSVNDFQTFLSLINRVHGSEVHEPAAAQALTREASALFTNENADMLHRFNAVLDSFVSSAN
jgi:hypothetical protein